MGFYRLGSRIYRDIFVPGNVLRVRGYSGWRWVEGIVPVLRDLAVLGIDPDVPAHLVLFPV